MASSGTFSSVSGGQLVSNYPGIVSITPQTTAVTGSSADGYTVSIPAWGVGVVAVDMTSTEKPAGQFGTSGTQSTSGGHHNKAYIPFTELAIASFFFVLSSFWYY